MTGIDWTGHLGYGLAWLSFGIGHSLLAASGVKARLRPRFGAWYRLAYNAVATVHIAVVFGVGWAVLGDAPAFDLPPAATLAFHLSAITGAVLMAIAMRGYDLGRLTGTRQVRADRRGIALAEDEPLRRDGLHRFVRHPIYTGALLFLWGRALDPLGVATALWGTIYLVIGILFEERKLVELYGRAYSDYRARVPMLVPWRGRAL